MPPVDQPETLVDELLAYQHNSSKYLDGQPMSVVVSCGPYTVDENLAFAPLAALLEEMANVKPDLLVLVSDLRILQSFAVRLSVFLLAWSIYRCITSPHQGGRHRLAAATAVPAGNRAQIVVVPGLFAKHERRTDTERARLDLPAHRLSAITA